MIVAALAQSNERVIGADDETTPLTRTHVSAAR